MGSHYLPQQYLRGFEVPDQPGTIWLYDKKLHRFKRLPIKVVAQEPGFYDSETESRLSKDLEGPGHAVLGLLRRGQPLSEEDRSTLARYVAVMQMRVPRRRRKGREMLPAVINNTVDNVRSDVEALIKKGADKATAARFIAELERVRQKFLLEPPSQIIDQIRSPWPTDRIVATVRSMVWRIIQAPVGEYFLTGDNPAFYFDAFGIGTPRSEISFPLASDLVLLGNWQGRMGQLLYILAKPSLVKEINRRVAWGAERFVFYRAEEKWVSVLAEKRQPHLSEIRW